MALDIRGSLKNTKLNRSQYIVFDELLSNAIDSYLIRRAKYQDECDEPLRVDFQVCIIQSASLLDEIEGDYDITLSCFDNGIGYGSEQVNAFITKDTSYKDGLEIDGLKQCLGSGRIQYFHYFDKIHIRSHFSNNIVEANIDQKKNYVIDEKYFSTRSPAKENKFQTEIKLSSLRNKIKKEVLKNRNLCEEFSAQNLKKNVVKNFLQRFVSLENNLGNFEVSFKLKYGSELIDEDRFVKEDLPERTAQMPISIRYRDINGHKLDETEDFLINHYKLDANTYQLNDNVIALAARSSAVKRLNDVFFNKSKKIENNAIKGFYHIVLIESKFLENRITDNRSDFDIPKDEKDNSTHDRDITLEDILEGIGAEVRSMLQLPKWNRDNVIENITSDFGITSEMISSANVRVPYGSTPERVVKRVLNSYSEQIVDDTSEVIALKDKVLGLDPLSKNYRDSVNELSWKYASSLKQFDMVRLSQVVTRRAAVIEILKHAIDQKLDSQNHDGKKRNEDIIHNVVFPQKAQGNEEVDHDIWLLGEEYGYFKHIASDLALSKITFPDGTKVFSGDVDEKVQEIYSRHIRSSPIGRPDIAIFGEEHALIVVEFKAPGVSLDYHLQDLSEYATLLVSKSNGYFKKVYGYLIGDTINQSRMSDYERIPGINISFKNYTLKDPETGFHMAGMYEEVMLYDDIVKRASMRLDVYKDKLNIS